MVKQIKIDENNVVQLCSIGGYIEGGIDVPDIPDVVKACPSRWCYIDSGYVKNPNYDNVGIIKQNKISELDNICTDTIYKGTDITLSTGETQHFTLDEQDQANLAGIGLQLGAGAEMISWHQDDVTKPCQFYTAEDAQKIINTLTVFKSYHITYFRDLRIYVNSLENIEDVEVIYYGYALPDEAKSDVLKYYEGLMTNNKS